MSLTLRPGRVEDAETCGTICYEAFKTIADQHNFPPDFPNAEIAVGFLNMLFQHPGVYAVVAERDGRIIGSNVLDERSAIAGVGPITAPEARSLAGPATDGTHRAVFRRLLTDPTTGVLTDIAEQQYRPSARLERAVRARDLTCRFPGCRRPALGNSTGTDVDHTVPWPQGSTTASNLAVLCRRHHRLKHTPGWDVVLHPDGTMTWTTPTGRTHSSEPWKYTDPEHNTRGQPPPQLE